MNLVFFFIAISSLFTAAAMPMLSFGSSSPSSARLSPEHVPKVEFGYYPPTRSEKATANDAVIDHYKSLEPGNEQKQARLAFVKGGWRDGKGPDDEHKQYLDFDYHRRDHPLVDKIGQTVTVSRDRPPPEAHFASTIQHESKAEMSKEMYKKYIALPPDQAKRVRAMKAHGDWADGPGLREETQFSYYHGVFPSRHNILWDPVTIHRPMSFLIDDKVPKKEVPGIKKRIRQEHEKLDENHPLKKANYGVVTEGWHGIMTQGGPGQVGDQQVGTTLYKVKDQLTDSAEEDFEKIGNFHVISGKDGKDGKVKKSKASSSSASSRT